MYEKTDIKKASTYGYERKWKLLYNICMQLLLTVLAHEEFGVVFWEPPFLPCLVGGIGQHGADGVAQHFAPLVECVFHYLFEEPLVAI